MPDSVGRLLLDALEQRAEADPQDTYDEALYTVTARAREARCLNKADLGSLVMWKRITAQAKWASKLGMTPDTDVKMVTGRAWETANDTSRQSPEAGLAAYRELRQLPGLGGTGALASAVLLACAPHRMAVWDKRVGVSLEALGRRPRSGKGFYGRYLEAVGDLAALMAALTPEHPVVNPRHVDLALYQLAVSPTLLSRAKALA